MDSVLLSRLREHGIELKLSEKRKSITDHAEEAMQERYDKDLDQIDNGDIALGIFFDFSMLLIMTLGFASLWPSNLFVFVLFNLLALLALWGVIETETHVYALGLWRYLWASPDTEITEEDVISYLSDQLQEQEEKALGVDLDEELQRLRLKKEQFESLYTDLQAKAPGADEYGMQNVAEVELERLEEDIEELEDAIENIESFLTRVRQMAANMVEEILPDYRKQEEMRNLLERINKERQEKSKALMQARKQLEYSRQQLTDKLSAIQEAIEHAQHVSANLMQLSFADTEMKTFRKKTETLQLDVPEDSGNQANAAAVTARSRVRA